MIKATNQYVTFRINKEVFAMDVGNAREIVGVPRLTLMPGTPEWVRGVMNLRGSVVPVIDLKHKLRMGSTELTKDACILIVEIQAGEHPFTLGFLVDAVVEVFDLPPDQIEDPPPFEAGYSPGYVKGMGRRGTGVFVILDAERVFSDSGLAMNKGRAGEVAAPVGL